MCQPIKINTAFVAKVGPVLDSDGVAVTGAVIGDFKIAKAGGNFAALNGSATATHEGGGHYDIAGTASDADTATDLVIKLDKSTDAMQPWRGWVYTTSIYDNLFGSGAEAMTEADVQTAAAAALTAYDPPTHAETNSAVTAGLQAYNLDHLFAAVDTNWATTVAQDSALGLMASKNSSNTFDRSTDSLEGVRDNHPANFSLTSINASGHVTLANGSLVTAKLGTFVLAKTTNITGFNDIAAADVWAFGTRTLTAATNITAAIADAIWTETLADHSGVSGSTAEALAAASSAGDPWLTPLPGAYAAGTAGNILGNNLDAAITSRLSTAAYVTPLDAAGTRTAIGMATASFDSQIAALPNAILDQTDGIETGITPRKAFRAMSSVIVGLLPSGSGSGTEAFKAIGHAAGGTTRVTMTVDASGNRTAQTLNL